MQRQKTTYSPLWLPAATVALSLLIAGCGATQNQTAAVLAPTPVPVAASCTVPATTISHTGTSNGNAAQIVFLDPKVYPQALCNDGTPAAYVLRPGVGAAAKRWVLLLQGGDNCYDQPTCSSRAAGAPNMVSSAPYVGASASTVPMDGIQSADPAVNPDFYDATQVQALYCSSDYWSGTRAATGAFNPDTVGTWNFQGRAILSAVVADLEKNHGLSTASELLLTGQSAGGVGVFAMVNDVVKLLPSQVRFVASTDAGFGSPAQDYDPNSTTAPYTATGSQKEQLDLAEGATLWAGHGDSACASAAAANAQASCYEGSTLLAPGGTITLPMLVVEAQQDSVQLGVAGVPQAQLNSANFTPQQSSYVQYFAQQMRSGLDGTNSGVSLFAPDLLQHTQTDTAGLFGTAYTFSSGSLSPQAAVKAWYQAPCTPQRNVAD